MAQLKVDKHVRVKADKLSELKALYPTLGTETPLKVAYLQKDGGRRRVYISIAGRADWICLWSTQVKALPRCRTCESEHHRTPRAKRGGAEPDCPADAMAETANGAQK